MGFEKEFSTTWDRIEELQIAIKQKNIPSFFKAMKFTTDQIAMVMNRSRAHVINKCKKGDYKHEKSGRWYYVSFDEFMRIINEECPHLTK